MDKSKGRIALVTDAAEGMGKAIVRKLVEHGLIVSVSLLGPNPKDWGPIDSGCPSVGHRFVSKLYLCNRWS